MFVLRIYVTYTAGDRSGLRVSVSPSSLSDFFLGVFQKLLSEEKVSGCADPLLVKSETHQASQNLRFYS